MIEIVAKKANSPKKPAPLHAYVVTTYSAPYKRGKILTKPTPSVVEAKKKAYELVVKSGLKKAYKVIDLGRNARDGWADPDDCYPHIYYTGRYGGMVMEFTDDDEGESFITRLRPDGNNGEILRWK